MLGYRVDEIDTTHDQWTRLVHPDDFKETMRALHDYWAGRSPSYEVEMRMREKSGRWHWVLARGKVASWVAPGQPEWMTGTNVDIHAQRRAKQLLSLQYAASETLNRSDTLDKACGQIAQGIAEQLECALGAIWI